MKRVFVLILFLPFFCAAQSSQHNKTSRSVTGSQKIYDRSVNFHQISTHYDPASFVGEELHFTPRRPMLPDDRYGWFFDKKFIRTGQDMTTVKLDSCLPYMERQMRGFRIKELEYIKAKAMTLLCFTLIAEDSNTYFWYARDIDMPFKKGGDGAPYVHSVYFKGYIDSMYNKYVGKELYFSHNKHIITTLSPFDNKVYTMKYDEPWKCVNVTFLFYDKYEYAKLHLLLQNKDGQKIAAVIDARTINSLSLSHFWTEKEQQDYLAKNRPAGRKK